MNEYLSKLIELGKMVGGRISIEQGFATFERLPIEELKLIPEEERAYATKAMGRAVFRLGENGKIINYKGVDSHLDNSEAGMSENVGAVSIYYTRNGEKYVDSYYPLNLFLFLGKRPDIRIRGASPLEDLEIEGEINLKMQKVGIKVPAIRTVKEFTESFLEKFGLPVYVDSNSNESPDYSSENRCRQSFLKGIMGDNYKVNEIPGKRPETATEYLERLGVANDPEVKIFLETNGLNINDFSNYVDKEYPEGQRYGQAVRELESPFRIADLEILIKDNNLSAIREIIGFTESMHPDRIPFENYFARTLGTNLGNMMNNGWECENFSHRQDYAITGEMCDDSYVYAPGKLECLENSAKQILESNTSLTENEEVQKKIDEVNARKTHTRLKYFTQIYLLSTNIKVLQDEMRMRGKSKEEIDSVLADFLDSFYETVDLEKASMKISDKPDTARKALEILVRTPKNMAQLLAFQPKTPDKESINEEALQAQKPFNSFFDEVSQGLSKRFNFDRSFINETNQDVNGVNLYEEFGDNGLR